MQLLKLNECHRDLVMKVIVKLFAVLKDVVKSGEVALDLHEGADIESLLENLSNEFGGDLENYLIDEKTKKPRAYLQIMVDGKYTSFSKGKKTTLRNGSVVAILPPIGGGMERNRD